MKEAFDFALGWALADGAEFWLGWFATLFASCAVVGIARAGRAKLSFIGDQAERRSLFTNLCDDREKHDH